MIDHFRCRRRRASACPRASTSRGRCSLVEREHRPAALMKEKTLLRQGRGRGGAGSARGAEATAKASSRKQKGENCFCRTLSFESRTLLSLFCSFCIHFSQKKNRYAEAPSGFVPPPLSAVHAYRGRKPAGGGEGNGALLARRPSERNARASVERRDAIGAAKGMVSPSLFSPLSFALEPSSDAFASSFLFLATRRRECALEAPTRDESDRKGEDKRGGRKKSEALAPCDVTTHAKLRHLLFSLLLALLAPCPSSAPFHSSQEKEHERRRLGLGQQGLD